MAGIQSGSFESPDETRAPEKATVEVVKLGDVTAARMTMEPGWTWSQSIKPIAGTDSCQQHHVGVAVSGQLHVEHEDGSSAEALAGNVYVIEPGHDAWVVGDEPFVSYEFDQRSAETFAKPD